jgi:hypothetical protein
MTKITGNWFLVQEVQKEYCNLYDSELEDVKLMELHTIHLKPLHY